MFEGFEYRFGRRWAWLATSAVLVAGVAQAQTTYAVSVNGGSLEPALLSLASQTKQQIMFPKGVVAGLRAPAVKGQMTPEQALAQLLAGTELRARRVNASLVVVERPGAVNGVSGEGPFGDGAADPPLTTAGAAIVPAPAVVDEVLVTGSNIRGTAPASPLVLLSRDDLERTGRTTVAEALRLLPANYTGGPTEGGIASGGDRTGRNTGSGTAINLRGLGANATLVLVNGRRMAGSGAFGDFADVSAIPNAAVQRVEVLLDGASAVYGSDAVGGVVNIILRQDYEGAETRLMGGIGTAGEPGQAQASQVLGRRWSSGGVVLAYELQYREALAASDRRITADADLRPLGGSDQRSLNGFPGNILLPDPVTRALTPTYAVPAGQNGVGLRPGDLLRGIVNRSNQRSGITVLPRTVVNSLYAAFDQAIGDRVTLSGDARFSSRHFRATIAPPITSFTVTSANPFFVSPVGATSQSMSYSFVGDLPNPIQLGTADNLGVTLGASVRLGRGWEAEAYGAFGQSIDETRTRGTVHSLYLAEALGGADRADTSYQARRDGFFNPFIGVPGANSPAALAHLASGFTANRTRNRVSTVSVQADGPLLRLPGGEVKLAVGAQARREALIQTGANFVSTPAPVPLIGVDVGRTVTAGFAEMRVPVFGEGNARAGLRQLELSVAARVERYEGQGSKLNPKVGVVWSPIDDLRLRATFGRSFRAPALREAFELPGYTPTTVPDGPGRITALLLGGGNRGLKPETAETWTFGADWTPKRWPGLALSLSAYDIHFKDRIDRPAQANLVNILSDPTLTAFYQRISPATNAADRALIQSYLDSGFVSGGIGPTPAEAFQVILDNRYVNTTQLRLRGLDLVGRYRFDVGSDVVALGAQATYVLDFEQQVTPTSRVVERAGSIGFPVRLRGRLTADWTRGAVTVGGAANYTSRYREPTGRRIDDLITFDLQARWLPERGLLAGTSVALNLRNAFDKDPPFYDNPQGIAYDGAMGDPVGRFVSVQFTRAW